MTYNTGLNASFPSTSREQGFLEQLKKLEDLSHRPTDTATLAQFDMETESLLTATFGDGNDRLETYKYATMAEAETMVNLPESAQEELAQDLPQKAIQQRRQVLEACISAMKGDDATEAQALTGEDHEDPPGPS